MAVYQFPGTNFHDANLDWVINQVKNCLTQWAATQEDWEQLRTDNAAFVARIEEEWETVHTYIDNYFANLDVSEEISAKLDQMSTDGSLLEVIASTVQASSGAAATAWIQANLSQQSGYAVDASLSITGAAADAKAAGDGIRDNRDMILSSAFDSTTSAAQIFPNAAFNRRVQATGYIGITTSNTDVINGSGDNSVYLRKGSTFTAKPGYYIRYNFCRTPLKGNTVTPTSDFIDHSTTDVQPGVTITTPQDCYAIVSARKIDGTSFSGTPVEAFSEAVTFTAISGDLKSMIEDNADEIDDIKTTTTTERVIDNRSDLFKAQQAIARDWHFPFINVYDALGLGSNHLIPSTAKTWSESGTTDLNQRQVWMSDGVHPYRGVGLVDMFGRTISQQIKMISPSYHTSGDATTDWTGKDILWMGTSIPAGSDPEAGSGTGATYPQMVASALGATVHNISRGSSIVRVNSSDGEYSGIVFTHFCRALTRTLAEVTDIAANWSEIYDKIGGAPSTLTETHQGYMRNTSFETLLMPYLDGTNTMPDLFVIDHGHNDIATGVNGSNDMWIMPTVENINSGILADDEAMTANNYAGLVSVFGSLAGIPDKATFAASVNRNCFQGACNFLITLILKYNPYARIIIISDYD